MRWVESHQIGLLVYCIASPCILGIVSYKLEYLTNSMGGTISRWSTKDGFLTKVQVLMTVCTLLIALHVVFGWWRRCSGNVFIKFSLWLAYTLTPLVATYTLGFISSFTYTGRVVLEHSDLWFLFLWSLSLVNSLGGTYCMTSYHVDDNKQYTKHLFRFAVYSINIAALWNLANNPASTRIDLNFLFMFVLWPPSNIKTPSSLVASSFSDKESLHLQDYMKTDHLTSTGRYNPVTLEGYNYLISDDITVSQVWLSNEGILGSSDGTRLKEVCLSYALFRLLRRRFFGAACPEATLSKTHDFVFKGLLSSNVVEEENYEAAYRVIETELAFTHDHFFTTAVPRGNLIDFPAIVGTGACIFYSFILLPPRSKDLGIIVTVILLVLLALDLLQLYVYLSSDHPRVQFIIGSSKGGVRSQFLRICNKLPQLFGYWQNKIGQHSLLKDINSRSITADVMGSLPSIFDWLLRQSQPPPAFPRGICNPGVKGPYRIPLTDRIKKAIAQTLKSSEGHLSNGTSSLERNGEPQLSEEFLLGSHASDLLIWHIATEYCDIGQSLHTLYQGDFAANRDVATTLSSYCAYLMAFVPELLPDHQLETTAAFHRTRKEALQHLQKDKTLEEKYAKLSGNIYGVIIDDQSTSLNVTDDQPASQGVKILDKGIQLGKSLQGITDDSRRWKILADFWTEMILYIAPSDNARDHIQNLANGGEFITHLWALLTHAGILDRGQRNVASNILESPRDGSSHRSTCTTQAAPAACAPNQPATTQNNHAVQLAEDRENAGTNQQPYPGELSYSAALRLRHASPYLDNCREGAAFTAMYANCVQAGGTMVQQQANLVQNVDGSSNACNAPREIEETEQ